MRYVFYSPTRGYIKNNMSALRPRFDFTSDMKKASKIKSYATAVIILNGLKKDFPDVEIEPISK